jgi:hypothetical protein
MQIRNGLVPTQVSGCGIMAKSYARVAFRTLEVDPQALLTFGSATRFVTKRQQTLAVA